MAAIQAEKSRRATLNLRIKPEVRELIDRAARLQGKNRTDFVLGAAKDAAYDAMAEQTRFVLDPKAYQAFIALLDAPPNPNERLRKTLKTRAPWEK